MKCPECGGQQTKAVRDIQLLDEKVGPLFITRAEFWECSDCKSRLYTADTALRISDARQRKVEELVRGRPISEFVSVVEAAGLLGVTRQGFHKNQRIRKGFIYGTELGRRPVYLRASVLRFGTTRDGRFVLSLYNPQDTECITEEAQEVGYAEKSVAAGSIQQWRREGHATSIATPVKKAYV